MAAAVERLKAAFADHRQVRVYTGDPAAWSGIFRILQGDEIRRRHGAWIDAHNPSFGPGIAERFRWTRTIDPAEVERMRPQREDVARHMDSLLDDDAVLVPANGAGHCPQARDTRRRTRSVSCACIRVVVYRWPCPPPADLAAARHDGGLSARTLACRAAWPRPGFAQMGHGEIILKQSLYVEIKK